MRSALRGFLLAGAVGGLSACGTGELVHVDQGAPASELVENFEELEAAARTNPEYDALFAGAGREFGVPAAVLKALSFVETRYNMVVGDPEFDGAPAAFGLMALRDRALTDGAALAGVSVDAAKTDPVANVRAAAAVLRAWADEAGIDRVKVAAWAPVIGRYSGIQDPDARAAYVRNDVFGTLTRGVGDFTNELAAAGQALSLEGEFAVATQALSAAPDFPGGVWRPSPNHNARPTGAAMVIIHTCESGYSGCWSWLTQSRSGVSAHYVVNESGSEVSQLVSNNRRAWHIGASYNCNNNGGTDCFRNGKSSNDFTVGIEHGGYASQKSFSLGQIDKSAKLLCEISKRHGIPLDRRHVVGHGQLQPYNRTDPGPNWPWGDYMARAQKHCGAVQCTVGGAIGAKYHGLGGAGGVLGSCTTSELPTPDGVGRFNHFQNGSIYWTPHTGAWSVRGGIHQKWSSKGWEKSYIGYPVTDELPTPDGVGRFNHFERGSIYWTPGTGAQVVQGAIHQKWSSQGWEKSYLGYPTTDELTTPDGVGRYNHFQRGSIYWTPQTGAFAVQGGIHEKWSSKGWEQGYLGYPISDEHPTPDGVGRFNHFQRGSIYWTPQTGAQVVQGAIHTKWASKGYEQSYLGYPVTDELTTPDGVGRYNHFQRGSIYWTPSTGAQVVQGAIHALWASLGYELSVLGYPIADEAVAADGVGAVSKFQNGSIYWTHGTGAHWLRGAILDAYVGIGAETSTLGYPVGDEVKTADGYEVAFQNGRLQWTAATNTVQVLPK